MKDLIDIIRDKSVAHPEHIAVIDRDRKKTYGEFWSLCNSFSSYLLSINEHPKIAFVLPQSIESYALVIASFNIGAIYCPLNPEAPLERKQTIIAEFNPDIVIVESELQVSELKKAGLKVELLTNIRGKKDVQVNKYSGDDIVYVIYTSGSTGKPKGVMICRKAINKFLEWAIPTYRATEKDIWGQFSLLSFDLSIVDILTCLCSGGTLLVMSDPASKIRPSDVIEKQKITIWHSIPSAVEFMIKGDNPHPYDFSSLKLMSFCGEPLLKRHVEFLFSKNKNLTLFNTYGPTEGTLFCTWQELRNANYEKYCLHSLSIGKPIPGWNILLQSVPDFEDREIVISGEFIGKGYLKTPDDNKFKSISVDSETQSAFETGDLVIEKDGNLFFSGRKDRQVKIKGHRIELDEIDFYISEFLKKASVTIAKDMALYSFVESDNKINDSDLRNFLTKKIEAVKIPKSFITIKEFPRNSNLKIDVNKLSESV